jgi:hypothetical protein
MMEALGIYAVPHVKLSPAEMIPLTGAGPFFSKNAPIHALVDEVGRALSTG